VVSEHPQVRAKRIDTGELSLTRIAEPSLDINRNVVDVNYTLTVIDRAGKHMGEIKEVQSVRYLFLPEIELLAAANGFEIAESRGTAHRQSLAAAILVRLCRGASDPQLRIRIGHSATRWYSAWGAKHGVVQARGGFELRRRAISRCNGCQESSLQVRQVQFRIQVLGKEGQAATAH
jgi:hypothetical protein